MRPHIDEPPNNGTCARNRKGSLSRKGMRRCDVVTVVLSIVMLMPSRMSWGAVTGKRADQLSLGDAVVAVRLSQGKSSAGLPSPPNDNWIMLLDAQGRGQATRIENKYGSDAMWTERGLSFGTSDKEYVTIDQGTQEIDVKYSWSPEYQRFSLPDGRIVVVDLNDGIRVDTIHPNGRIETMETSDTSASVGQRGQHIVGITDTEEPESIRSAVFEVYTVQSSSEMSENVAAVIQIDEPAGDIPRLLAAAPAVDGLVEDWMSALRGGNVITVLSLQQDDPAAVRSGKRNSPKGILVLQRWDLSIGQRTIIPVPDEVGQPIETDQDNNLYSVRAIRVGNEYRLVVKKGDAFAVDITSSNARHLFSIPLEKTFIPAIFQVSETGVYVLEQNDDEDVLTLSYQPWDGGGKRVLLTTGTMSRYLVKRNLLVGYRRSVESFALRPGQDGGTQQCVQPGGALTLGVGARGRGLVSLSCAVLGTWDGAALASCPRLGCGRMVCPLAQRREWIRTMEPYTDEPLNNGTRARSRKGSLNRKGVRRSGVGAAALSIVMLLSGCLSLASLDEKPIGKLMTGEAVTALWLDGAEAPVALPGGMGDNWIVLLDFQGRGQAEHVERGERGNIVWTELGMLYDVQVEDFSTMQEGMQRIPRVGDRPVEYFRLALLDGRIEVISAARGSDVRAGIIGRGGTMTSVETDDKSGSFGLYGSWVLAIMNTEVSQSMRSAAFEVYAAQSGGEGSEPKDFSVAVQLDDPAGVTLRILAAAPMIPGLRSA